MEIELTGLSATGFHGVLDSERREGQPFVVDVVLRLPPPAVDQLWCTVDYSAVAAAVKSRIEGDPVDLIETLAMQIAHELLMKWPLLSGVVVTVHKPHAPIAVPFTDVSARLVVDRQLPAQPFVLSLGANLGDAAATLRGAVTALAVVPGMSITAVSEIFESAPVEVDEPQPDYVNLVVTGLTTLDPKELLLRTSEIENHFGRQRPHRHAARSLDIDIVKIGDIVSDDPELTLPHPRAAQRAFVLVPWLAIDPDASLPQGRIEDLASHLDQRVTRTGLKIF